MEKPKMPVKIVCSKKLPPDFAMPIKPQLHKVDSKQRQNKRENVAHEKVRDKDSNKNPFKSYRKYINHAERCTEQMKDLPGLDLTSVEHLIYQRQAKQTPAALQIKPEHLVTLGVIKNGRRTGTLRKTLHVPSFTVHVSREQPVQNKAMLSDIKHWVCTQWKSFDSYDYFLKISQNPFWNLPEGCVTVLSEFAEGGSLHDLIRSSLTLPEMAIRQLVCQLLQTFLIISRENISYEGLSPTQVLFNAQGQVKLSLGLAKLVSDRNQDNSLYDRSYGFAADPIKSQIFKIGLLTLNSAIGNFQILDDFIGTVNAATKIMKTFTPKSKGASKLCCLVHSEHLLSEQKNSLAIISLLSQFSPAFIDFLCSCMKINPFERMGPDQLLNHPFICKQVETKRLSIKDMIRMGGGSLPAMEKFGGKRLKRFIDSISIILTQMGYQDILNIKRKCKVGAPAVKAIADQLGVEQAIVVLKIKELLV